MKSRKEFFNELTKLRLSNDIIKGVVLVHSGVKPSAVIMLFESQLPDNQLKLFKELLRDYGLCIAEADYKFILKRDAGKGGWANKGHRIAKADSREGNRPYYIYYYIARSKELADEIRNGKFPDPEGFGQVMGYPGCCRDFYIRYIDLAHGKQGDFTLYSLAETKEDYPYDFYNNYVAQYFGYSLLSHFTCSFNCKESSNLARRYYGALKKYSKGWADMFLYCQKSAIIYTEYKGIFLIKNFELDGNVLRYGDSSWLYSTITNKNLHLLKEANNILINSKNNFSVRKGDRILKTFKGDNVGLMIFG